MMGRYVEAHECIKECYSLWAMNHLRNPGSMKTALALIQSCLHNKEYDDAEHYARHAYFMIAEMTDNFIPSDQQPWFLAEASRLLALAISKLAQAGGIPPEGKQKAGVPPEGKQKAGEEATTHAREALELHTQLYGAGSIEVAHTMGACADVLGYFNNSDVDTDEVIRLLAEAIVIFSRIEPMSVNVASGEYNLASTYVSRTNRAYSANDFERCIANMELALPHFREAARIFRANNHVVMADKALQAISQAEENILAAAAASIASAGVTIADPATRG